MKKINLKKPLMVFGTQCVDQNGKVIMIHEAVANALAQGRSAQPAKSMSIATRLFETGVVELDQPDIDFLLLALNQSGYGTDLLIDTAEKLIKEQTSK